MGQACGSSQATHDGDRPPDDTVEPEFPTVNADLVPSALQPTVDIPPVNPDSENLIPASVSAANAPPPTSRVYPSRARQPPEWYGQVVTH